MFRTGLFFGFWVSWRKSICWRAVAWQVGERRVGACLVPINIKNEFLPINQIYFNIIGHMQIWLHQLDGTTTPVSLQQVQQLLALNSASNARIVAQGSHLTPDNAQQLLFEGVNAYVVGSLDGGKKKKKKKVYTTKKKNKHIHKRVPMGIYNLYSVDGKGNVSQQRKTCPSCGPGTFMGQHWDRYYCGFCHTTIKMDPETIKKNEEILKKKKAALEAEKKAKEKEAADKAPAGKGKKDAKKGKKK